jgi:hypothetical protein
MKFPVVVRLINGAPLWEPQSSQNFWKVGDVSNPLFEGTDFSAIRRHIKSGRLVVVMGSLEDEPPIEPEVPEDPAPAEEVADVKPKRKRKQ